MAAWRKSMEKLLALKADVLCEGHVEFIREIRSGSTLKAPRCFVWADLRIMILLA
jgi:hypothetical protein